MNESQTPTPSVEGTAKAQGFSAEAIDSLLAAMRDHLAAQGDNAGGQAKAGAASKTSAGVLSRITPRLFGCLLLALGMTSAVAVISPQQLPVACYKLSLMLIAGVAGYWLDRWAFPYARPDSFLTAANWRTESGAVQGQANHAVAAGYELIYAASQLRRALIMLGAMLAMGLGL